MVKALTSNRRFMLCSGDIQFILSNYTGHKLWKRMQLILDNADDKLSIAIRYIKFMQQLYYYVNNRIYYKMPVREFRGSYIYRRLVESRNMSYSINLSQSISLKKTGLIITINNQCIDISHCRLYGDWCHYTYYRERIFNTNEGEISYNYFNADDYHQLLYGI